MSEQAIADLDEKMFADAEYPDPADQQDCLLHYPSWLWEGYIRETELREGLGLQVHHYCLRDRWNAALPERQEWLSFHFHLSGQHRDACTEVNNLEYALYGGGLAPQGSIVGTKRYPIVEVHIWMSPQVFLSFVGKDGELPLALRHLVRPAEQLYYTRVGTVSSAMQRVLWQIILGKSLLPMLTQMQKLLGTTQLLLAIDWTMCPLIKPAFGQPTKFRKVISEV